MIRFATLLFVLTWNTAMAADAVQNFGMPLRPPTPQEQFLAKPEGQELLAIFDMAKRGNIQQADEAYRTYQQKYNVHPRGSPPLAPGQGTGMPIRPRNPNFPPANTAPLWNFNPSADPQ